MAKYMFASQNGKAYYWNTIPGFIKDDSSSIIGQLVKKAFELGKEQSDAWDNQIKELQTRLSKSEMEGDIIFNPALEIEGFLLTMYDSRLRLANQIYDEVKRHFQELVFKTVIQRNVKLSESPSHGLPVILYDADSTGSKNHLALAKEIISKNS